MTKASSLKLGIRSAGVLLHPTSLPGPHGIGDLGPASFRFIETLNASGQTWWQMLPVVPPGFARSPYDALSAFAGNPLLLSLESLAEQGWLSREELDGPSFPESAVDFDAVERFKLPLLLKAFESFSERAPAPLRKAFKAFCSSQASWLEDYALFSALRQERGGEPWTRWDEDLRLRKPAALAAARKSLEPQLQFQRFLQFEFSRQWSALREHAGKRGVGLIGDVPIFVAHDSADVWANQELFWLEKSGRPLKVAGVPPDYFSKTGQLWGNPLYRWDILRKRGFGWWLARFRSTLERFDAVRLDHFIGFHNYWEIAADSPTAEVGRWVRGPGAGLFERVEKALGRLPLIAEDLGVVTEPVKELRDRFGFPGMKVLQMAFGTDPEAESYRPHSYPRHSVVYTGTHDHDTTFGWFNDSGTSSSTRTPEEIRREHDAILRYVGTDGAEIHWDMIRLAFMSVAETAVVPMQDVLGLSSEARMNLPGTLGGNWRWRLKEGAFSQALIERLAALTETYGRRPPR